MNRVALLVLDGFFYAFHTTLILFNVFGWIPQRTRRLNLACLLITATSWLIMGAWRGVGYCLLTDWHWQIRQALGIHDPESSFVELFIGRVTGWHAPKAFVQCSTTGIFLAALLASVIMNIRLHKRQRSQLPSPQLGEEP